MTTPSVPSATPIEGNKTLVQRLIESLNSGDLHSLDQIIAPDFVHRTSADPTLPPGPEGMRHLAVTWMAAFPDGRQTLEDQIAGGDKVVTRWTFRGTHRGALFGVAPTGKEITFSGTSIDRVAGGKIVERWDEADILGALQQLESRFQVGPAGAPVAVGYTTVRHYHVDSGNVDEIVRRAEQGFVPLLRQSPGFVRYAIADAGGGEVYSFTTFAERAGAEESTRLAADWVGANLASLVPNPPEVTAGTLRVRRADPAVLPAYAVIRRYLAAPSAVDEIVRRAAEGFAPLIGAMSGFSSYSIIDAGHGTLLSISAFADRDAAEESTRRLAEWIKANLVPLLPSPPYVVTTQIRLAANATTGPAELLGRLVSMFNDDRIEESAAAWAPDGRQEEIGTGRSFSASESTQNARAWKQAFPDARGTIETLAVSGNRACAEVVWTGTNTGSFNGALPTGKAVTVRAVLVLTEGGGKIVHLRHYLDIAGMMAQLGVGQPAAAGAGGTAGTGTN